MAAWFRYKLARPAVTVRYQKALVDSVTATNADQYHHVLILRIMPFEKILIQRINKHVGLRPDAAHIPESALNVLVKVIFFHWSWSAAVLRGILDDFDPHNIHNLHLGSQAQAFSVFEGFLRSQIDNIKFGRRDSRVDAFLQDNPDFVSKVTKNGVCDIDWERITVQPHNDDAWYWKELAYLFHAHFSDLQNWSGFRAVTAMLTRYNDSDSSADDDSDIEESPAFTDANEMIKNIVANCTEHFSQIHDAGQGDEDKHLESHGSPLNVSVGHTERSETTEVSTKTERKTLSEMEQSAEVMIDDIEDTYDVFDIWIVHRKALLLWPNIAYTALFDDFYHSKPFAGVWKTFKVYCNKDGDEFLQGQLPIKKFNKRTLNQVSEFFSENFEDILDLAQEERKHNSSLEDPASHLTFIPWSELHDIKPQSIRQALDDLGLHTAAGEQYCGVLNSERERFHFTFFVKEEHFGRQILGDYAYPGLCFDDMVILRRTDMGESPFCSNIKNFWTNYNDCALTRHPISKHFYLLESLPGVKARQLMEHGPGGRSRLVAYFDQKWRQRDCLTEQQKQIRAALGPYYKSSYSDFLVYIPVDNLDLSDATYIGSGRFGKVFRARWHAMPVQWPDKRSENFVAIKVIQSSFESQSPYERQQKLLHELNIVYTALAGYSENCVKFYGITKIALYGNTDQNLRISGMKSSKQKAEIALVFEYASEGTIREFMKRVLRPGASLSNWTMICTMLADIVRGLSTIHARGIAHRDLHMNNVLVQAIITVSPAETETTYSALLADLGQGKVSTRDKSYTDQASSERFDQPEEMRLDIRAWAQMGIDLIRLFRDTLVDSNDCIRYPEKLMQILNDCLKGEDEGDYSALLVVGMMGQVVDNLDAETGMLAKSLEWKEETFQLAKAKVRLSSSLRLTSTWLNS